MKFFGFAIVASLAFTQTIQFSTVQCGQGMVPMAGKAVCIQPNYIEGCQSYISPNECGTCNVAYTLNSRRCDYIGRVSNIQTIPGCLSMDENGKCTNCANGFRRIDGVCKVGFKYCQKYDESGKCTDCRNDYSLVLGRCRHNFLLGCRTQQADHSCKQCFAPFKMNGNHCDIAHCKSYNDFGCVGCDCGYFLTSQRYCKQVTSGCVRYQRGVCTNCLPHYKLKGGLCQIDGCLQYDGNKCTKCEEKYVKNQNGGCNFKNCYDWLDGKCIVCSKGYRKQNDQCVKVTEESLKCM